MWAFGRPLALCPVDVKGYNSSGSKHNGFWGVARSDEQVLVAVNPSAYVREVSVVLAQTGSDFRVHLDDSPDWLEGEWSEGCRHECEWEALAAVIPSPREHWPTAEALAD
jgi:hypothetical protein